MVVLIVAVEVVEDLVVVLSFFFKCVKIVFISSCIVKIVFISWCIFFALSSAANCLLCLAAGCKWDPPDITQRPLKPPGAQVWPGGQQLPLSRPGPTAQTSPAGQAGAQLSTPGPSSSSSRSRRRRSVVWWTMVLAGLARREREATLDIRCHYRHD